MTPGDGIRIDNSTFNNSTVAAGRGASAHHGGSTGPDATSWAELAKLTVGPYVVPAEEIAPIQEFVTRHGK